MEGSRFYADAGPAEVRVYSDTGRNDTAGNPVVTDVAALRAPDHGDVDSLLRAHGWRRVSAWSRSDDTPAGHKLAMIEPGPIHNEISQLVRDQAVGRERRGGVS